VAVMRRVLQYSRSTRRSLEFADILCGQPIRLMVAAYPSGYSLVCSKVRRIVDLGLDKMYRKIWSFVIITKLFVGY
jgi:hypothetical protein